MTDKLPPNLLALFAPRPPLRYLPPSDHAPEIRKTAQISGVAQYLQQLKEPDDFVSTESWLQRRDRVKQEKKDKHEKFLRDGAANFNPSQDPNIRGEALKTLFISRLSYDARESDLEREFSRFGPIERIRIVTGPKDGRGKGKKAHRGYAFIVFDKEGDMKAAYKETDGIRIKDRRIVVDVERGRTVKGWKPRKFGGGLGGRGYTKAAPPRPPGFGGPGGPPSGFRGGFRGDFRGGFGGRGGGGFRGDGGGYGRGGGYGGGRGGVGYQGGGGFGGRGGGYGGQSNGYGNGQPPANAPSGPGGGGRFGDANGSGGYGDSRGGGRHSDDRGSYRGNRYGDRGAGSGSNREPVRPREGGGYRDRDRDGGYGGRSRDDDGGSRKRYHDSEGYDDHRSKRRY
ncbi:MAG: hypothetical protein M1814_003190 [Vezdaea aestivalis]|nr:MAG: hypothetical protein M1814_003190 [Vezdaea aestivalis]